MSEPYYDQYMSKIRRKYRLYGMQLDGFEQKPEPPTLKELIDEVAREDAQLKGMKVATGCTTLRGQKTQLWYDVSG